MIYSRVSNLVKILFIGVAVVLYFVFINPLLKILYWSILGIKSVFKALFNSGFGRY